MVFYYWALFEYPLFRYPNTLHKIINPDYILADIFKNNALNNGLLPITVSPEELKLMMDAVLTNPRTEFVVNLEQQKVYMDELNISISFDINSYKKTCLLNGYDDLDYLLSRKDKIVAYENANA